MMTKTISAIWADLQKQTNWRNIFYLRGAIIILLFINEIRLIRPIRALLRKESRMKSVLKNLFSFYFYCYGITNLRHLQSGFSFTLLSSLIRLFMLDRRTHNFATTWFYGIRLLNEKVLIIVLLFGTEIVAETRWSVPLHTLFAIDGNGIRLGEDDAQLCDIVVRWWWLAVVADRWLNTNSAHVFVAQCMLRRKLESSDWDREAHFLFWH